MAKRFQLSYAPLVAVMAVVVLLMALPSISAQGNKSPESSSPPSSDEEFFRNSCKVTSYPDVCNGMVPMVSPSKVKQNPFEMVKQVVEFSRLGSQGTFLLFGDLSGQGQLPGQKKGPSTEPQNLLEAVQSCSSSFLAVVNLKSRAVNQLEQLNNPTSSSNCKAEMKNVQTWLLDAMKEEAKCMANIMKKYDETLKTLNMGTKVTSNALDLAKDFVVNH